MVIKNFFRQTLKIAFIDTQPSGTESFLFEESQRCRQNWRSTSRPVLSPFPLKRGRGTLMGVQGLGLCASTAGGISLISGWGAKILHAKRCSQTKRKKAKKQSVFFLLKKLSFLLTSCQNRNLPSNEQTQEARERFQKVLLMRLWAPGYYQVRLNINT